MSEGEAFIEVVFLVKVANAVANLLLSMNSFLFFNKKFFSPFDFGFQEI